MEQALTKPILLFNDECAVCRVIARWVRESAKGSALVIRPIGNDPVNLRELNPKLDIWDAYAHIHLLMPDGSMKIDGEAVAETLRNLPITRWLAGIFNVRLFARRPFQAILNGAYNVLADMRPLLGCESCGIPPPWLHPIHWLVQRTRARNHVTANAHHTSLAPLKITKTSELRFPIEDDSQKGSAQAVRERKQEQAEEERVEAEAAANELQN